MTFAAMAAWQAWLLIAAAGALAVWLFLVKLRPPRILVPSLLLWRRVLDESRELTLWERIRRTVSLVLTLLVALVLALAAARRSRGGATAAAPRGRLLIVIDSSWSMLARTASGATRWDRAKAEARRLAAGGDQVALATTADGLVEGPTSDLALIETTLDRLAPAGGEATAWPSLGGSTSVHFITDGAIGRPLDPAVIVHTVFEPAANVAVTAFEVRPSLGADHAAEAYLEIANYATSPQDVH
ncbi:MAG: VWA domain-containing protein, partial [Acidobacteriota bacterium]